MQKDGIITEQWILDMIRKLNGCIPSPQEVFGK